MEGRHFLFAIILVTTACSAGQALQSKRDSVAATVHGCRDTPEALRALVREVHVKQRNVGVAASIRRDGIVVFSEQIGQADLEHGVPVTKETRFGVASLTKLFTAVTLLALLQDERVDLDASVQQYLPSFPRRQEGEITLRMLATHRSGLPHPAERTPELFATHYETAFDAIEVFADAPLAAVPGAKRVYSSSNYNLLAAVMEAITGKGFPELVRETIFDPLGLERTTFDYVLHPLDDRSERYSFFHPWTYAESDELYEVPRWDYSFNMGGGNITSTAEDISKFGSALINPGLLDEESLEILYDEAWFGKRTEEGSRFLFTTGANPGVQAGIAVVPESGISAAVLSNTWGIGSRSGEMAGLANRLAAACD